MESLNYYLIYILYERMLIMLFTAGNFVRFWLAPLVPDRF